jgi:hypothetical protein
VLAQHAEKDIRWTRGNGAPTRIIDASIDAVLGVLYQSSTRQEIAELASRALGVQVQTIHGGVGWGSRRKLATVSVGNINILVVYLLRLVVARGVVFSGPNRENEPIFVRADACISRWQDAPLEQAEVALLRRYLCAFGPAIATDYALWTGMTLT